MNTAGDIPTWLWAAALLSAVLVGCGAYFGRTGLAARRRGDVPHCARCDYIVDGLESTRCPECGSDLNLPRAVARGEQQRRPARGVAGLLLALLGIALAVRVVAPGARAVDWYLYRPTAWVIGDFRAAGLTAPGRSWAELQRRTRADDLSDTQLSAVRDAVLDGYVADPTTVTSEPMTWLIEYARWLSDAQRERLFAALFARLQPPTSSSPPPFRGGPIGSLPARREQEVLGLLASASGLDNTQHARLTEMALAEQATPRSTFNGNWLLGYLARRELAGVLTGGEREQFFQQACRIGPLEVRKRCVAGDPIPYRVAFDGRWLGRHGARPHGPGWSIAYRLTRVTVDGRAEPGGGGPGASGGQFFAGSIASAVAQPVAPGEHRLAALLTWAVYYQPDGAEVAQGGAEPRWEQTVTLHSDFEVLAAEPPGLLKWVDDPSLAKPISWAMRPADVIHGERDLAGMFAYGLPPVNVSFDVIVRTDGHEHPIGTLAKSAGSTAPTASRTNPFPTFSGDTVDLILRSGDQAMRNTVDMYEAWRGEVVYEDVRVELDPP